MGRVDILKMNPTRDGFNPNPTRLETGWVDIHKMNPTRDGFNPNPTRLATGWVDIHKMNPTRDGFNPNPTRLGTGWVDIHKTNPTQPITRVGLKIPTRPDPCAPLINQPDQSTFHRKGMTSLSVIDLVFVSQG